MNLLKVFLRKCKSAIIRFNRFKTKVLAKHYYRKTVFNYDDLIPFFEGKSIAIVGGADSVFAEKKGAYIDSFDIVIRINRGIDSDDKNADYLGNRTDVLFHGLNEDNIAGCGEVKPLEWLEKGVKKVVFPYNDRVYDLLVAQYVVKSKKKLPLFQLSKELFTKVKKLLLGGTPTTGFSAIYLMSQLNLKKLYITGFTFFKTPHRKGYNEGVTHKQVMEAIGKGSHKLDIEYNIAKEIYLNKKIEVDKALQEIFENN